MTHQDLSDTLIRLRLSVSASDLHGSLTGLLCGGGKAQAGNWLAALELDADPGEAEKDPMLRQFHRQCREQLDDSELGFAPLLPDDETSIAERSETYGLATGESAAHLNYLYRRGRVQRELGTDGAWRYHASV